MRGFLQRNTSFIGGYVEHDDIILPHQKCHDKKCLAKKPHIILDVLCMLFYINIQLMQEKHQKNTQMQDTYSVFYSIMVLQPN